MTYRTHEELIQEGQVLTGPQFNEAMRVLMSPTRPGFWSLGLVGQQTQRFPQVTLSADDIAQLATTDPPPHSMAMATCCDWVQAYALGIAHEFDPYFGLSISHVDPLPHQKDERVQLKEKG